MGLELRLGAIVATALALGVSGFATGATFAGSSARPTTTITPSVTSAQFVVTTQLPTKLAVFVGLDRGYGRVIRDSRRKVHRISIDGLSPGTRYQCLVRAIPATGKPRTQLCSFQTQPPPPKRFANTSARAALASATTAGQAEQALKAFFAQYGLTLSTAPGTPNSYVAMYASFTALDETDLGRLRAYGEALIDEWAKYPVEWVRATGVVGVALVKQLTVIGTSRAAMPDEVTDIVYYDVGYQSGEYARGVIHHELEHLVTFNASGSYRPFDAAWNSLNPPGFRYGNGGASCYEPTSTCLSGPHPVAGFVSGYATSAMEEDKAETYSYLLTSSYYQRVENWILTDSHLAAKVAAYKQSLCQRVLQMCGSYFDDINP